MREVWPFCKAVFAYWWMLMGCAAFTIMGIVLLLLQMDARWSVGLPLIFAAAFLFVGCYLAWRKEYLKNIGGVDLQIDWRSLEPASFDTVYPDAIDFHNRGPEYASRIVAGAFSRSDLTWTFGIEIPSLAPDSTRTVEAHFQRNTGARSAEAGYMKAILEASAEPITIPVRYSNTRGAMYSRLFTLRLVDVGRTREISCEGSEPKLLSRR